MDSTLADTKSSASRERDAKRDEVDKHDKASTHLQTTMTVRKASRQESREFGAPEAVSVCPAEYLRRHGAIADRSISK